MKGKIKNIIALVLLILFVSIKLTGLHELTHDDNHAHENSCVVCDFAVHINSVPFIPFDNKTPNFEIIQTPVALQIIETNLLVFSSKSIPNNLFSRPPPQV